MAKDLGENFTEAEIQDMVEEADRDRKLPFIKCIFMHLSLLVFCFTHYYLYALFYFCFLFLSYSI